MSLPLFVLSVCLLFPAPANAQAQPIAASAEDAEKATDLVRQLGQFPAALHPRVPLPPYERDLAPRAEGYPICQPVGNRTTFRRLFSPGSRSRIPNPAPPQVHDVGRQRVGVSLVAGEVEVRGAQGFGLVELPASGVDRIVCGEIADPGALRHDVIIGRGADRVRQGEKAKAERAAGTPTDASPRSWPVRCATRSRPDGVSVVKGLSGAGDQT